jgi:putative nucleotidyltransferase with HDIG domain
MMSLLEEIRPRIRALDAMPSVPAIVQPLAELLRQDPDQVSLDKVVELVSYDSTLAAQCLRMANSPLFGRRNTETVRGAVLALGIKRVEAIVLGCCLNRIVPPDKWALDPLTFWRHCLGCALISSRMARLIGYPDPEKAYLAGLLHDLGILVNTVTCTEEYRRTLEQARERRIRLHESEQESLGFTHCQSGAILAQQWKFSLDVTAVIEFHHDVFKSAVARPLVALVHLSDLLCRLRELGYGYYEAIGVDLAGDDAWSVLLDSCPALAKMDLARLTMDIDGAMEEIVSVVDAVFRPQATSAK